MAGWYRRKNGTISIRSYSGGREVAVIGPEVKALKDKPDAEIQRWVENWEVENNCVPKTRNRKKSTATWTPKLAKLLKEYQKERAMEEKVARKTLAEELGVFENYIFPFFLQVHGRNDPARWDEVGFGFRGWLTETTSLEVRTKKQIIEALNRFGAYLKEVGAIDQAWKYKTPKTGHSRTDRKTPLELAIKPEDIFAAVKLVTAPEWKLSLLVGYFAVLRPEEVLALTKEDFLTGALAVKESQTYLRLQKKSLDSKLAVKITKALVEGKKVGPPKNYNSNGIVTIWNKDAALQIAAILKEWPDDTPFFTFCKTYLFKIHSEKVRPHIGVTMHDLRRAGGLYLGRTLEVEPWLLQDVMRHKDLDTTMLYTRRPVQDVSTGQQDFNDVV